jgi:tripartite-type tricarboxylate transporter receptor subunit TctC
MHVEPASCPSSRREFVQGSAAAFASLLALGAGTAALAQSMMETVHVLCGSAAGSTPDIVARRVAEQLSGRYAKSAIVDNRPGAAGRIAVNAMKLAAADGSTLLLGGIGVSTLNPLLYATLAYDPVFDLRPVSLAAEMPLALAIGSAVPASVGNVSELIEWMRANPQLASVGSPGVGSLPHLLEAMLFRQADASWQHVAYSGGAPAVVALLGGQIAALILPEAVLGTHRAAGKLRVLATSGPRRSAYMADVPNFVEQGYRDLVAQEWFAFFMSGRVPQATIDAASQSIRLALSQPELMSAFAAMGMVAAASTPGGLAARIASEQRLWEPIIRAAAIRPE